jgi:hypothetical protein
MKINRAIARDLQRFAAGTARSPEGKPMARTMHLPHWDSARVGTYRKPKAEAT